MLSVYRNRNYDGTYPAKPDFEMSAQMITWHWSAFYELSLDELYDILTLRSAVFVVEQDCPFLDMDGLDRHSWHLFGRSGDELIAYARVSPPGLRGEYPSIGRIVTAKSRRRKGVGTSLMREAIRRTQESFPQRAIRISAQLYLEKFYTAFGFYRASEPYEEDGIPHIEMLLCF
jgi:ElaA protein